MMILLEEIMELIPHRKPFLFIDECEIIKTGEDAILLRKIESPIDIKVGEYI